MDNNTKMLMAMMANNNKTDDGGFEKYLMQSESDKRDIMMQFFAQQQEAQRRSEERMEAIRAEAAGNKDTVLQMQLGFMQKEMDDYKNMAMQDPIQRLFNQKQQLQQLGIVHDGKATVDEKTVEVMGNMMQDAGSKFETAMAGMAQAVQPIIEAQGEILKKQGAIEAPKTRTDSERAKKYFMMKARLEQANAQPLQAPPTPPA
jgi:hypothetical protein